MVGANAGAGLLWGIAPDHRAGVAALVLAPIALFLGLWLLRGLARAGGGISGRLLRRYDAASAPTRLAAWLMWTTAAIHLALVPAHAKEAPGTAWLFALDGALFVAVGIAAFVWRRWRPAAAALLGATVLTYLLFILAGKEDVDELGVATKLVELLALGLVLLPAPVSGRGGWSPRWFGAALAMVLLVALTGVGIWGATGKAARAAGAGMESAAGVVMQPVPPDPPTAAQRAAADRLAAATREGIARYADVSVALADGYRPMTPGGGLAVHYANPAYLHDGRVLDPTRPPVLVYANTPRGPILLGAMYMMPKAGVPGPDVGGPITRWHVHTNLCFGAGARIVGILSPFGACPAGSINAVTPAMMHVWTVPVPGGPFADLDPAQVARDVVGSR